MSNSFSICVIAGDGIGPEVTGCARQVLDSLAATPDGPAFTYDEQPAGHGAWLKLGNAIPPSTLAAAKAADAVMLGACDVAQIPAGGGEPRRAPPRWRSSRRCSGASASPPCTRSAR